MVPTLGRSLTSRLGVAPQGQKRRGRPENDELRPQWQRRPIAGRCGTSLSSVAPAQRLAVQRNAEVPRPWRYPRTSTRHS